MLIRKCIEGLISRRHWLTEVVAEPGENNYLRDGKIYWGERSDLGVNVACFSNLCI